MEVRIREAAADDADRISHLVGQLGFDHDPETIRGRLTQLRGHLLLQVWVAELEGVVVGLLTLQILPFINTEMNAAQLGILVVDAEHRRRGIGSMLVREAERFAKTHCCGSLKVFTHKRRRDAHAFYASLGYRVDGDKTRFVKGL